MPAFTQLKFSCAGSQNWQAPSFSLFTQHQSKSQCKFKFVASEKAARFLAAAASME
jgi:hypothetical protein